MNKTLPDDKFDKQQKLIEIMNESETENEDTSDSVYDDVMRTMCERHIVYLIPLINKYLNTHYTLDADIQLLNNEHHKVISEKMDLKATDAFFQVTENTESHIYHLECQSTADSSMIIRIVEYDFMIALDEMSRNISNKKYHSTLQLPETKEKLNSIIQDMSDHHYLFTAHPSKDFSRQHLGKLSFYDTMQLH